MILNEKVVNCCIAFRNLQLLFWLFLYFRSFEKFEFQMWEFNCNFHWIDDFKRKSWTLPSRPSAQQPADSVCRACPSRTLGVPPSPGRKATFRREDEGWREEGSSEGRWEGGWIHGNPGRGLLGGKREAWAVVGGLTEKNERGATRRERLEEGVCYMMWELTALAINYFKSFYGKKLLH